MKSLTKLAVLLIAVTTLVGCGDSKQEETASTTKATAETPVFTLAWSEYPSWSAFGVASEKGLIDGAEGKLGALERKHNVDIVLREADYDTCITMYGSGTADATCITNMDILQPSLSVPSVAILPTSTSAGADALITVGIDKVEDLKGVTVYGLEKSVSQYTFARNIEIAGLQESDFTFKNQDPAAAAQAMQTGQDGYNAIVVWNPFVNQTLKTVQGSKVLFDSTTIPGEIIDMVVVSQASLDKEGGERFASCVCETFYGVNELLNDPTVRDDTLVSLGAKFSSLNAEEMAHCLEQTVFYKTPTEATQLFEGTTLPQTMERVTAFCTSHGITDSVPKISYDGSPSQLTFSTKYIKSVK
jgi:NitT/TauT family transport system substrate-binding protein